MNILIVVNKPSAKNVSMMVRLPDKRHQKKLKVLMSESRFQEAFDFVFSKAELKQYLDPKKDHIIKAPEYTLVEDLVKFSVK